MGADDSPGGASERPGAQRLSSAHQRGQFGQCRPEITRDHGQTSSNCPSLCAFASSAGTDAPHGSLVGETWHLLAQIEANK